MPLSAAAERDEIHHRHIEMRAYRRTDGLFDIEARLVDRKTFPFQRALTPQPVPAGAPLHDLWIRLTVDRSYMVRAVEAASDTTPFAVCKDAQETLGVLVGERIAAGWSRIVKDRLRGAASCTHLVEMLIPLGTTALQGIRGLDPQRIHTTLANGLPAKLDSCYAYATNREVVMKIWPEHYRAPSGKG
jgi:hypothetical protein